MRCLRRNQRVMWFSTYKDKEYVVDENGRRTGDLKLVYNEPVKVKMSISATTSMTSASRGAFSDTADYGVVLNYDRRIVTDDMKCPIEETSVMFINEPPKYINGECQFNFDHEVIKKVVGLDNITYYVKRLT